MNSLLKKVVESTNTFEEINNKIKKDYFIKNIDTFSKIVKNISGYKGFIGIGYPFYAFKDDSDEMPIIEEQIRYNNELLNNKELLSNWYCETCLKNNLESMPDLKYICKRCKNMDNDFKPRKVITRIPDMDYWIIIDDSYVDQAKDEIIEILKNNNLSTSDTNPINTINDFYEIALDIKNEKMPSKYLPVDIHLINYNLLCECINNINSKIDSFIKINKIPYFPIHTQALRKKWQYDEEACDFIHDYLYSFTEYDIDDNLSNMLYNSRRELVNKYTNEELYNMVIDTGKDFVIRRQENIDLQNILNNRINKWREPMIDLHMHTNKSDGVLSPTEIIDEAVKNNVKIISITDHDNIGAYNDNLFEYAKKNNITLIPGIEISTLAKRNEIHILGYNFDLNSDILKQHINDLKEIRLQYLFNVTNKLNDLGYIVNIENLKNLNVVTKAHIANDIINNKDNYDILIKNFNHIPNMGEFIEIIMNENCPAYVKKETITSKEAVKLIHEAGGKAVIAHPVSYNHEDDMTDEELHEIINEIKPDGIEAYYLYVDRYNNKFDECDKWIKFAKDNNLFVTIGSDFHKKDNIHPEIGFPNWKINITDKEIKNIINNIKK